MEYKSANPLEIEKAPTKEDKMKLSQTKKNLINSILGHFDIMQW